MGNKGVMGQVVDETQVFKVVKVWSPSQDAYFDSVGLDTWEPDYVLVSAFAPEGARVIYPLGEWVRAPWHLAAYGYNLTAFDSFGQAKAFIDSHGLIRYGAIFEATGRNVQTHHGWLPPILGMSNIRAIHDFLEAVRITFRANWPCGTVMAESMRLKPGGCVWSNMHYPPLDLRHTNGRMET